MALQRAQLGRLRRAPDLDTGLGHYQERQARRPVRTDPLPLTLAAPRADRGPPTAAPGYRVLPRRWRRQARDAPARGVQQDGAGGSPGAPASHPGQEMCPEAVRMSVRVHGHWSRLRFGRRSCDRHSCSPLIVDVLCGASRSSSGSASVPHGVSSLTCPLFPGSRVWVGSEMAVVHSCEDLSWPSSQSAKYCQLCLEILFDGESWIFHFLF